MIYKNNELVKRYKQTIFGDSYFFIEKCLKFEDDHKKMNMKENLLGKSGYIEVNSNSFELLTNKMVIYYLL